MDYKIALESKQEMGELFIVEGIRFRLLVTPEDSTDFATYCDKFNINSFTDESAIPYSTNGKYEVRAIRIEDGIVKWEFPEIQEL